MPFNISSFKSNGLVYGGARPSLFNVEVSLPPEIGVDPISLDKFRFVCRGSQLPPSIVAAIPVPYFGRNIKVAGQREFPDWGISVMNDEDFAVRGMFEKWSNAINRHVSNVRNDQLATENYKADMIVNQYSKDGDLIRAYRIVGAFPTMIGPMQLDWEAANQIQMFEVTIAYDYWLPDTEQSDKNAGGVNTYLDRTEIDGPLGPN